jgi:DNA helicase-4
MKCYYDLVARNSDYKNVVTKFFGEKYSLTKSEHEYSTGEDYYKDRRKYGIIAPYTDMEGKVIYTRSEEEKKICTWLTTHGVEFAYEKPYPIETGDEKHRNYKPDFTIFFNRDGKRYYFFLEHFGIDAEGKVPRWFGEGVRGGFDVANRKYNEGIEWKRATHKKNHTLLIETTSAMFKDGTVFNHLEEQLRKYGVPMYMLTPEERYERMFKQNRAMEENVRKLFSSFINLMKSNEKTFDGIMHEIDQSNVDNAFKERNRYLMYKLIRPLYYEYQISMDLKDEVDFTDLILRATELCKSKQWKSPYSYILVDEFQDISVDRYKFLKSLRNESPRTQLFCVGDDWQSIYRFSGSDISLFNHFEDFFGPAEKCKIETTYRFCNPLIERSSQFILQNSNQLKKNIKPFNTSATTELSFIPFKKDDNYENFKNKLAEILRTINQGESILLLGRYKQDADMVSDKSYNDEYCPEGNFIIFRCMSLEFMTIHSAKGLEADHVIILNCSQDRKGFPSRISDDPILEYLLSRSENYMDAEERRLFYVAITRARIHTYVMYNEDLPSIFVTEMLGQNDSNVMLCPCCKSGVLKPVYDGYNAYGRKYRKFLCGNSIAGCSYEWTTFYHDESEIVENYHRDLDPYLKLDKIKIDSPEALNEFGNMLRNKEEYERIK